MTNKLDSLEAFEIFISEMRSVLFQILALNFEDYISKTEKALVMAPFIDPTLWINSQKNATKLVSLAKDLLAIKTKYMEFVENEIQLQKK